MDLGTQWYVAQRQRIARFDISVGTGLDDIVDSKVQRRQYIAFFTVDIVQQCNSARTVGVVFDRGDFGRNTYFIAFKVNDPVMSFAATTAMPAGYSTVGVASALFLNDSQKLFFGL